MHVSIDTNSEPIHGTVDDGATTIEFTGWLELMSAFDTAREPASEPTAPTNPAHGPE